MSETLGDYIESMGYIPCYKFPEEVDEDEEFMYYKFRVPRIYIREHIAEGNVWPDYVESFEEGTKDKSVVLGVSFFPVYTGVEYLGDDVDFLYYKAKVPKAFLNTPISGTPHTYHILYDTKDFKLKSPEELAEIAAEVLSCAPLAAGESMPNSGDLSAIRKVKESNILLYEVIFYCGQCDKEFDPEVGSDLWDLLYGRSCIDCGNTNLEVRSCKSILEENVDE